MIYDEYIQYSEDFRNKYGVNTTVLMQVGDFFELYGVQTEEGMIGADMYTIGDLCNLTVTRKNKSILENSRTNPLMAGFPKHAVSKHIQTLVNNGYTVVMIEQVTPPPNVTRKVTQIISPSMIMETASQESNFLMTYLWDTYKEHHQTYYSVGMAGVDVSTGHTFCYEVASTCADPSYALDEAYRMLQAYQPREIMLLGDITPAQQKEIESLLASSSTKTIHRRWGALGSHMVKITYQQEILQKVYGDSCHMLTPIEELGLETLDNARLAYVAMLMFAFEHNDLVVKRLQKPHLIQNKASLGLEYNSAVQLNVLGCMPNDKPLISILNRCCTSFGKRLFREYLLSPSISSQGIQDKYDRIERLMEQCVVPSIRKSLQNVVDMERLARKMQLGTLSPVEWYALHTSLDAAKEAAIHDDPCMVDVIRNLQDSYARVLSMEECSKYVLSDVKGSVFHKGIHHDIDQHGASLQAAFATLEGLANDFSALDPNGDSCLCKVDSNERDGYYLQMTKKRWEAANQKAKGVGGISLKEFHVKPISAGSSVLRIQHPTIEAASNKILAEQRMLCYMVTSRYKEYMESFQAQHIRDIQKIVSYIANLDVAATNAHNATEFGYCKPEIRDDASSAFIDCKGLRHPIIERLSCQTDYVKNDVKLGARCERMGMLLYGINASGKSSLMKAIGLSIIMAQSGMYVPATHMVFKPFHHIFTRISGMDNLYRGMSTFTVEMAELRNILQRCDQNSIVLGDELCAGTESVSAISIVAAGIHTLRQRRSAFVFATHLHELTDLQIVTECKDLHVCHMHIEMDNGTGKITYDRTLRDGRGSSLYGLEVCKALSLPESFIKVAHEVRRTLQQVPSELMESKWSRYNKNVCMGECKVCGKVATETHHIRYQQVASSDGFVDHGVRIHDQSNLVPLCEECHQNEHKGTLKIHGYKQTSCGVELSYERVTPTKKTNVVFEDILPHVRGKFKYMNSKWMSLTKSGMYRKCTIDTVINYIHKKQKYQLTPDELAELPSELREHPC
jgi:DNA mismatch repair protein MutS